MTKRKAASAGVAAGLAGVAAVLRFALRGYDVVAGVLVVLAVLLLLWAFVGGAVFKVAAALMGALAVAVAITEVPIVANSRTDAGNDVCYLVVLGARVDEGGEPSYSLRWRLEAALDFLEAHPGSVAVLSGGQGADEPCTEASCMQGWLVAHGVAADMLILEEASTNTRENLENSFALLRGMEGDLDGKVAVVSSSYHLYRAKLIAHGLGLEVAGVAAYPGNPVVALNYFIREAPAVWKQLVVG